MWLDKIKEMKEQTGTTKKSIAELLGRSERTIARFFAGETDLGIDEVCALVRFMGGSMDEVLAESDFKIPAPEVDVQRREIADLQGQIESLKAESELLKTENTIQKDRLMSLTSENELLRLKLNHKEELLALHSYYMGLAKNREEV